MDDERDAQLTPDESSALAALREPAAVPPDLYLRVSTDLRRLGAFRPSARRWLGPMAAAAGIVLAFFAGQRAASEPEGPEGTRYALLLLNTPAARWPDSVSEAEIVEEFRSWARPLAAAGRLVLGDELGETHLLVDGSSERAGDPSRGFNGVFVVTAADDSAAIALARSLPHVRQGGVVSVQRLMSR